ncbi:late competence development ComFB family protein [Thiomicrorhabdus sediminis]|uniref:Competence protein ComFB n=1 Tax=Thiomicrorhabdus sediminis TaxID=2580412 RepID=A0A4P9K6Q9_9GAMM|nr:late competence development ComFB family protein [Thiomicrorhabdus sediminis]QCU90745.1 competence protein ComFB [Thiomicrorhabdus sediminis]
MYLRKSVDEEEFDLDSVHNYYERLVFNEINDKYAHEFDDSEHLADMACIALNEIPPRYIRYDIDMSFYMSPQEYLDTQVRVQDAVRHAYKRIKKHQQHRNGQLLQEQNDDKQP